MSNEAEEKLLSKNGILIHKLPRENLEEVLDCFPSTSIYKFFYDDIGLYIYFHDADQTIACALDRIININGQLFDISLTVTNLTLHGISSYTKDIKTHLESNGYKDIIDCYLAEELKEHEGYKSFRILSDYRVILNIPEVFANHNLAPILLPELPNHTFQVSFFCRLCRENGHKALECHKYFLMGSESRKYLLHRNELRGNYSPNLKALKKRHSQLQTSESYYNYQEVTNAFPSCSTSSREPFQKYYPELERSEFQNVNEDTESEDDGELTEFPAESSNPQVGGQRKVNLSEGIQEAISHTNGVLQPDTLIRYLNQVRRRKLNALMEITLLFTERVPGLIQQLKIIERDYRLLPTIKTRGGNEERDIIWLKRLCNRLNKLIEDRNTNLQVEIKK